MARCRLPMEFFFRRGLHGQGSEVQGSRFRGSRFNEKLSQLFYQRQALIRPTVIYRRHSQVDSRF
jgi:hypothetical protein